jgi:hypothetical protein
LGEFNKKYNSGEKRNFNSKNFDRKPRFDNRNSENESKNEKRRFHFRVKTCDGSDRSGKNH